MKNLSSRFILSNILTAALLIFFSSNWKSMHRIISADGSDPAYGIFIFVITIVGMIANTYKAYDVAYRSRNKLKWFEQIFLVVIYIAGFGATVGLIFTSFKLMGPYQFQMSGGSVFIQLTATLAAFILLVLESFFFQYRPKKLLSKIKLQFANVGSALYSGVGISVLWNALIIGRNRYMQGTAIELLGYVLILFALVFPFQRIFWYEVLSDAESKLDHLKTAGAILLVMAAGIVPLYFT